MKNIENIQKNALPEISKEYRKLDWAIVASTKKSFEEIQEMFHGIKDENIKAFADHPFLYLHFLRGIEMRLVYAAIDKKQPISKCLSHLVKLVNLGPENVGVSKTITVLLLARYAIEQNEIELAKSLLKEEALFLKEIIEPAQACLKDIIKVLDSLE